MSRPQGVPSEARELALQPNANQLRQKLNFEMASSHWKFGISVVSYPEPIEKLIEQLRRLPGVGPKTAERFVFHLLRLPPEETTILIQSLAKVRDAISRCEICWTFSERTPCSICADKRRDRATICVVSEPADIIAIERTGEFRGIYHVLDGLLAPIEGIGPEQLRISELLNRIRDNAQVSEIIFAFDPTIEGETTVNYLARLLASTNIRLTRLARGLPVGGDLEYADPITLGDALTGRRELKAPSIEKVEKSREISTAVPF